MNLSLRIKHHKVPVGQPQRQIQEGETVYGVAYNIKCCDCANEYNGEMARMLSTKFSKYTSGKHPNSTTTEHTAATGHCYTMNDTKILVREDEDQRSHPQQFPCLQMRYEATRSPHIQCTTPTPLM